MRQTGIGNAAFKAIWKSILKTLVCTGSYFASAWEQCPETEKGEWALGQEGPGGSRARRESGAHTCVKRSQVPHRLGSQLGEVNVCVRVECPSSLWLKPKPKPPLFGQWSVCAGKEAPLKSTVATLEDSLNHSGWWEFEFVPTSPKELGDGSGGSGILQINSWFYSLVSTSRWYKVETEY